MRVVFMGSPAFALPSLNLLAQHHDVVAVVTQPDRPAGRGRQLTAPPVKLAALSLCIPVLQPSRLKADDVLSHLSSHRPDVIVVTAYGQILPPQILELPPHGCVNVHASLLPRWRGAAPVPAAILHGDEDTGVTIMKMDPGLDTGPIIAQHRTSVQADETGGGLSSRLGILGAQLLIETLAPYCAGELPITPQDDSLATYAPLLKKSDGRLDWHKSALHLCRQVRAFDPWPAAFFTWKQHRISVHKAHSIPLASAIPGQVVMIEDLPAVGSASGLLVLDIIQQSGRRPVPANAFLHGSPNFVGANLLVTE